MKPRRTELRRRLDAPPDVVYRALTDAVAVAHWMVPHGMTSEVHQFEAREGGAFRISLTYEDQTNTGKTSAHTDTYHGRFVRLVPNEEVVQVMEFESADPSMQGEMRTTFRLTESAGGTELETGSCITPNGIQAQIRRCRRASRAPLHSLFGAALDYGAIATDIRERTTRPTPHATPSTMTFACDMTVFTPEERQQHIAAIRDVFGAVREIREVADGYAFRFEIEDGMLARLASFVAGERLCCPFFGFQIRVEPEAGPIWVSLAGSDGIKPFIRAEVGPGVPDDVSESAGFR